MGKRKSKRSVPQSSVNCTKKPVVCQVVCQVVLPQVPDPVLDQRSKKSIKISNFTLLNTCLFSYHVISICFLSFIMRFFLLKVLYYFLSFFIKNCVFANR